MKAFNKLSKLKIGDQVAIISPSAGTAGQYPWVLDLGLERLNKQFGLLTKEYPSTRKVNSTLEERAKDIMNAYSDKKNKAVIATIGGFDQIRLIKMLDPNVFLANPKPFFGFSDNTHLHNFLWKLGIPTYYGGAVMTQFAMQSKMDDFTVEFLDYALFKSGEIELKASDIYNDEGIDWSEKENLKLERKKEPNEGWVWDGKKNAKGILWGGCVESIYVQLCSNIYLPSDEELEGTVLFLETAEDIPEQWIVEYLLIGMGERGWLDKFQAVLVGRPKAWEFNKQNLAQAKSDYRKNQQKSILKVVRQYNKDIPVVQNLDFGHTDPQIPIPMGRVVTIETKNKKIFADFS